MDTAEAVARMLLDLDYRTATVSARGVVHDGGGTFERVLSKVMREWLATTPSPPRPLRQRSSGGHSRSLPSVRLVLRRRPRCGRRRRWNCEAKGWWDRAFSLAATSIPQSGGEAPRRGDSSAAVSSSSPPTPTDGAAATTFDNDDDGPPSPSSGAAAAAVGDDQRRRPVDGPFVSPF